MVKIIIQDNIQGRSDCSVWKCDTAFGSILHENGHVHTADKLPNGQEDEGAPLAHLSQPSGQVNHGGETARNPGNLLLSMKLIHMDRILRKVTKTESHPNNTNSECPTPKLAMETSHPLPRTPGMVSSTRLPGLCALFFPPSPLWPPSATYSSPHLTT
jgi:hypothetical protein